jgi:hypothetical protein
MGYFIDVGFRDMESVMDAIQFGKLKISSGEGFSLGVYIGSQLVGHFRSGEHSQVVSDTGQGYSLEN